MTARPEGFDEAWSNVVAGWLLIRDFDDVTRRIETLAGMITIAGLTMDDLTELQRGTVSMMIQRQVALGIERGDFDDLFEGEDDGDEREHIH